MRQFLTSLYNHVRIDYPKFYKMDNLCKLGWLASEILMKDESIISEFKPEEIGTVFTNANASLDTDLNYFETTKVIASPALFVYTLPNIVIGEISIRWHFKGENAFFVFKQFDGNFIEKYVNSLFENKLIKNCICGWVDFLKEDYRALLFLVETSGTENAITFTADKLNQLNQQEHG